MGVVKFLRLEEVFFVIFIIIIFICFIVVGVFRGYINSILIKWEGKKKKIVES